VSKPIAGRMGHNIAMFEANDTLVHETGGRFERQNQMYQQFFKLPTVGGYNVQISTFTAGGRYAASCARVDVTPVIDHESDNMPLRIVDDEDILREYAFSDGMP
jgi:glutathionylspermidine amidase/synthetase